MCIPSLVCHFTQDIELPLHSLPGILKDHNVTVTSRNLNLVRIKQSKLNTQNPIHDSNKKTIPLRRHNHEWNFLQSAIQLPSKTLTQGKGLSSPKVQKINNPRPQKAGGWFPFRFVCFEWILCRLLEQTRWFLRKEAVRLKTVESSNVNVIYLKFGTAAACIGGGNGNGSFAACNGFSNNISPSVLLALPLALSNWILLLLTFLDFEDFWFLWRFLILNHC